MTAAQLMQAAAEKKAVTGLFRGRFRTPAAFLINMQFWQVAAQLPYLKVYNPKKARKTP